jgi:hypothetical protein
VLRVHFAYKKRVLAQILPRKIILHLHTQRSAVVAR